MRIADHEPVAAFQLLAHGRELALGLLAGQALPVQRHGSDRCARPVDPDGIDRIVVHRHEFGFRRCGRTGEPLDLARRVQPGVVADAVALDEMRLEPALGGMVDERLRAEHGSVDLLAHLYGVTPVDEDCGLLGQHHGDPGRAGEARQPGEPLGPFRHIFVLMLVRARHHEAVELTSGEFLAQGRGARGALAGIGSFAEGLEHALEHERDTNPQPDRAATRLSSGMWVFDAYSGDQAGSAGIDRSCRDAGASPCPRGRLFSATTVRNRLS